MSTDPSAAALTHDDSAGAAGALQTISEQSSEVGSIVTAIERVEALLGAGSPEPEGSEAIERIADIAFVLHERDVEASLCDALDAAVRELACTNAAKQTNVHHVRQAAEMLRELSQRVADMVALLQVSSPPAANDVAANETTPNETAAEAGESASDDQLAGEDALDGEIPREGLFPAELLEDDEFARAVAELAASLPALAEPIETIVVMRREFADLAREEPYSAPQADEAVVIAPCEATDIPAGETISASEPDETTVVALRGPVDFVAEEPTSAPEADEAVSETQSETNIPAADEPGVAFVPEEAIAETLPEAADLAMTEPVRAPEFEAGVCESQHDVAGLPANEPALEQPPRAMDDATAMQQTLAEEFPLAAAINEASVSEESAREVEAPASGATADEPKDNRNSNATPGERASSEALYIETPLNGANALASDNPLTPVSRAEPKLPPRSEATPPADAQAILPEQPPDQTILRPNGDDESAQVANESPSHNADEVLAESAAEVKEEPPPRFAESSQMLLPELALVDPQDDPGDLFEPLAGAAPSIAAADLGESQSASEISEFGAERRTHSATAAADPLAAMRALSAEELLALFT